MPDFNFTSFPIPGKRVDMSEITGDIEQLQSDVTGLNTDKADKTTTINGLSLAQNRTLYVQDVPSKNVLSPYYIVQGSLSSVGEETYATTRCRSGYTPVSASTAYTVSVTSPIVYEIHEYTSANAWIKYTSVNATSGEITTSATTAYLRILFRKSDNADVIPSEITDPMVRPSIAPVGYVPYAKTNAELTSQLSSIGKYQVLYDASFSVPNQTMTVALSETLPPGRYIAVAGAIFDTNNNGDYRYAALKYDSESGDMIADQQNPPCQGVSTRMNVTGIVNISTTQTICLVLQQASGSALNCNCILRIIRISDYS